MGIDEEGIIFVDEVKFKIGNSTGAIAKVVEKVAPDKAKLLLADSTKITDQ